MNQIKPDLIKLDLLRSDHTQYDGSHIDDDVNAEDFNPEHFHHAQMAMIDTVPSLDGEEEPDLCFMPMIEVAVLFHYS